MTPVFSATVSRKIIMAPLTGTQQLISYSSFSCITVFGGPVPVFLEDSQQKIFYEVGLYLHVQPPAWRTRVSLVLWVITFDLSGMGDLAVATIPPV
jgi:hypothetical protein